MKLPAPRPFFIFLVASIIAHAVVLVLPNHSQELRLGPPATELQVSLLLPSLEVTARTKRPKTTSAQVPVPAMPAPANSAQAATDGITPSPTVTRATPATANARQPDTRGSADARAQQIRRALWRALDTHFYYPLIAQRNGWQGEVRLALIVGARGQLSNIRIVQTSGYAILDEAARDALLAVRHVPEAGVWLDGSDLSLILPIRYRLVSG
ncbi:MAG: energy transducer TonB [Pseudomonadota bacterium]|nr:MAG: energy transducer TonB [Pseudomonadota bacterium]